MMELTKEQVIELRNGGIGGGVIPFKALAKLADAYESLRAERGAIQTRLADAENVLIERGITSWQEILGDRICVGIHAISDQRDSLQERLAKLEQENGRLREALLTIKWLSTGSLLP